MDARIRTERYYSRWLGSDENLFARSPAPLTLLCTPERNIETPGYGRRFDIWTLEAATGTFVSYGDAARDGVPALEALLRDGAALDEALRRTYGAQPAHSVKYVFSGEPALGSVARPLMDGDYPAYERFFRSNNPDAEDLSWLREYFDEMVAARLCCGVFADGLLVSCTDAPLMPYMAESVQEIGINTLPEYRGRGHARAACARCVAEILAQGKCPIWSADAENAASQKLAEAVGFARFADAYALSLT